MNIYRFLILSVAIVLTNTTYAQIATTETPINSQETSPSIEEEAVAGERSLFAPLPSAPEGTVNCFDYYTFGSVQVDVGPMLEQTVPGVPLTFSGKIKNDNSYPIVGGQVYAKIFKREARDSASVQRNGHPLVAFFLVKDNISLGAKGTQELTFDWNVPHNASGGEYEINFFFTTAYRFNLLGLTFTDDISGNKAKFRITDDINEPVAINKDTVTLNESPHSFAAFLPTFSASEPVTASIDLVNQSNESRTVSLEWVTSKWDALLPEHEAESVVTEYVLLPGEKRTVSYLTPTLDTAVTFIEATLKDKDAESILHIRYTREVAEEIRINYPSITNYPLTAGQENGVFSCLHSTNKPLSNDAELTLSIKDEEGLVVHSYVYQGAVTGAMMGVKDVFMPSKDLYDFTLTATLKKAGKVVDSVDIIYDCALIGADCPTVSVDSESPVGVSTLSYFSEAQLKLILLVGLCVILIIAGLLWYRRTQTTDNSINE